MAGTMTADLDQSCDSIRRWYPIAMALIAEPDQDGTTAGGKPGSRPPWNPAAATAAMDAHEGLPRLEASMRLAITGHLGARRGGSDANVAAAIAAIERLGSGLTAEGAGIAARIIGRWVAPIEQLAAVDEDEPCRKIAAPCPYCRFPMLRVRPRSGLVACLRGGACLDGDGRPPQGVMDVSRLTGDGVVRWADGRVTP
jgi:hypothetical protein